MLPISPWRSESPIRPYEFLGILIARPGRTSKSYAQPGHRGTMRSWGSEPSMPAALLLRPICPPIGWKAVETRPRRHARAAQRPTCRSYGPRSFSQDRHWHPSGRPRIPATCARIGRATAMPKARKETGQAKPRIPKRHGGIHCAVRCAGVGGGCAFHNGMWQHLYPARGNVYPLRSSDERKARPGT